MQLSWRLSSIFNFLQLCGTFVTSSERRMWLCVTISLIFPQGGEQFPAQLAINRFVFYEVPSLQTITPSCGPSGERFSLACFTLVQSDCVSIVLLLLTFHTCSHLCMCRLFLTLIPLLEIFLRLIELEVSHFMLSSHWFLLHPDICIFLLHISVKQLMLRMLRSLATWSCRSLSVMFPIRIVSVRNIRCWWVAPLNSFFCFSLVCSCAAGNTTITISGQNFFYPPPEIQVCHCHALLCSTACSTSVSLLSRSCLTPSLKLCG